MNNDTKKVVNMKILHFRFVDYEVKIVEIGYPHFSPYDQLCHFGPFNFYLLSFLILLLFKYSFKML